MRATASWSAAVLCRFSSGRTITCWCLARNMPRIWIKNWKSPTLPFTVFTLFHYFCKKVTLEDKKWVPRAEFWNNHVSKTRKRLGLRREAERHAAFAQSATIATSTHVRKRCRGYRLATHSKNVTRRLFHPRLGSSFRVNLFESIGGSISDEAARVFQIAQ